jgi:hypothetical protein
MTWLRCEFAQLGRFQRRPMSFDLGDDLVLGPCSLDSLLGGPGPLCVLAGPHQPRIAPQAREKQAAHPDVFLLSRALVKRSI